MLPKPKLPVMNPFGGYRPVGINWKVNLLTILFIVCFCGLLFVRNMTNETAMDSVEERVAELRGLQTTQSFERRVVFGKGRHADERGLTDTLSDRQVRVMVAFDMLDAATDASELRASLDRWYASAPGMHYDYQDNPYGPSGRIVIVSKGAFLGPEERLVYAHEFAHVLQDQHFSMERCRPAFSEKCLAQKALLEGEAEYVMEMYGDAYLLGNVAREAGLEQTPCLSAMLHFPYQQGREFVRALHTKGGWEAVNAAHANPPQTTEQVLHPDRYFSGDVPQDVFISVPQGTLGYGWRFVDSDVLGEYRMRCYLSQQIPVEEAAVAAEGWDGDLYRVYYKREGKFVLVFRTAWDTPVDAKEFVAAYESYAEARSGQEGEHVSDDRVCWDGGKDYVCLTWGSTQTTIVLGPDGEAAELLLDALELTDSRNSR